MRDDHPCVHSPSQIKHKSSARDTEHIHCKHGGGAPLSPFLLFLVAVLAEHVGRLSSGDRDCGLRIWNEKGRSSEQVWKSLLVVTPKVADCPCWLWRGNHKLSLTSEIRLVTSCWRAERPEMEDAARALQQQVRALMNQNAAFEAELRGQQNIARGLAELPGAITTVLHRSQAPTRRMLVDPKGLGKATSVLRQRRRLLSVAQEGRELRVGCVPECAWSFDVCSSVARRGHSSNSCRWRVWTWSWDVCRNRLTTLHGVVSPHGRWALRRCDVSRRRPWLRELAQVAQKVGPVYSGTSTKSLEGDSVAAASEVAWTDVRHREDGRPRETLLWSTRCPRKRTHFCGRHSHEFTWSLVAGWSQETCAVEPCETDCVWCLERRNQNILWVWRPRKCTKRETERFITPRRRRPNGHRCVRQKQGQTKQMQARWGQRQREARTARTTRTGQGQEQGQEQGFGWMLELWKARALLERLLEQEGQQQRWFEGKHKPKHATDAHNFDSTKSANVEPEVEIGGFNMCHFDANAVEVREFEWIKIGADTGAGKTAWPQSVTYGKMIPGDNDLTFRTTTGELVKAGKRLHVEGCDDFRVRGVQAPVCKPLLSVGECTTMGGVTVYGDKGYMFHRGSNVAKKIDAWTDAYKENNVYNIYMKPRGNKTDTMPLSGDSESRCCRPFPNP